MIEPNLENTILLNELKQRLYLLNIPVLDVTKHPQMDDQNHLIVNLGEDIWVMIIGAQFTFMVWVDCESVWIQKESTGNVSEVVSEIIYELKSDEWLRRIEQTR